MTTAVLPASAVAELSEARRAWRNLNSARAQINRLHRYRRMTDGMKADYARYLQVQTEAQETLQRVLGGAE